MGICLFGTRILIGLGEKLSNINGFCNQITVHSPPIRYTTVSILLNCSRVVHGFFHLREHPFLESAEDLPL